MQKTKTIKRVTTEAYKNEKGKAKEKKSARMKDRIDSQKRVNK